MAAEICASGGCAGNPTASMRDVGFEIVLHGASPQSIVSWDDPRFFHVPRTIVLLLATRCRQYRCLLIQGPPMPRRLPPLNALRVFEVAARSANFTRAAQELGVSQAAVSQQVKSLEATLGLKLFSRDGKRLVITGAGKQYLAVICDALDRIAVGTDHLLQSKPSSILTVSTSPDFGAKWLVHRRTLYCRLP